MLKRLIILPLAGALLAGCAAGSGGDFTIPVGHVGEREAQLAAMKLTDRGRWCLRSSQRAPLEQRVTVTGSLLEPQSNVQRASNALFRTVEAHYGGSSGAAPTIRHMLKEGAQGGAFTVLVPYVPAGMPGYNPLNEPVFHVAAFLVPLSHAYLIVKQGFPKDEALLAAVKTWGDRLYEVTREAGADYSDPETVLDRRASIAAGWAFWGNVANNRRAIADAYLYLFDALASIGPGGVDQIAASQAQIAGAEEPLVLSTARIAPALVAAHALYRSGAAVAYTVAPGGGTIVESAAWLWNRLQVEQPDNLLQARDSGSEGVGWAELFLRDFPNHPLAAEIDAGLDKKRPLYLNNGGGPTTCLYRPVASQS